MARTKNRFNAMVVPETVSADMPVTIVRSFRVALYARLSVELKARPSESIANQLDIMREYVKGKAEFAEWYEYVDNAVSGTNFDRPSFKRMMDDVRNKSLSAIMDKVGNVLPVVMLLILGANNKTSLNVRKENVNYACIFDR